MTLTRLVLSFIQFKLLYPLNVIKRERTIIEVMGLFSLSTFLLIHIKNSSTKLILVKI